MFNSASWYLCAACRAALTLIHCHVRPDPRLVFHNFLVLMLSLSASEEPLQSFALQVSGMGLAYKLLHMHVEDWAAAGGAAPAPWSVRRLLLENTNYYAALLLLLLLYPATLAGHWSTAAGRGGGGTVGEHQRCSSGKGEGVGGERPHGDEADPSPLPPQEGGEAPQTEAPPPPPTEGRARLRIDLPRVSRDGGDASPAGSPTQVLKADSRRLGGNARSSNLNRGSITAHQDSAVSEQAGSGDGPDPLLVHQRVLLQQSLYEDCSTARRPAPATSAPQSPLSRPLTPFAAANKSPSCRSSTEAAAAASARPASCQSQLLLLDVTRRLAGGEDRWQSQSTPTSPRGGIMRTAHKGGPRSASGGDPDPGSGSGYSSSVAWVDSLPTSSSMGRPAGCSMPAVAAGSPTSVVVRAESLPNSTCMGSAPGSVSSHAPGLGLGLRGEAGGGGGGLRRMTSLRSSSRPRDSSPEGFLDVASPVRNTNNSSNNNNNNKRPLTPKSMPPAGDEHAKLKT